jgi:UDP-GlcNAc:undecaprenyl-phosphate/decaprenyl-phosphate GlcNAc-1-phosphate transferase
MTQNESIFSIQWLPLLAALVVAALVNGYLAILGIGIGEDTSTGIQKFHSQSTSRLGGLGIFLGVICGVWFSSKYFPNDALFGWWLLFVSLPVFMGGILEDITHKITPLIRLILACLSAAIAYFVFNMGVTRTDIQPIDVAIAFPGVALIATILVVAGFINAINIIDGFHGLASGVVIIMLTGLASVAFLASDGMVFRMCLLTATATLGFAIWNWPFGKVFLGDGGAYLLGLWVVELGLLIPHRSLEVSPMAPVLVGLYPLIETLYSMYRRRYLQSHPVNHPDALHLHTLIYRRLILNPALDITIEQKNRANSKVSVIIWGYVMLTVACAVTFYKHTYILFGLIILFSMLYIYFYKKIIHFKAHYIIMLRRKKTVEQ